MLQEIVLKKGGNPLGFSIVGGSDHASHPFGVDEPGIFISKVSGLLSFHLYIVASLRTFKTSLVPRSVGSDILSNWLAPNVDCFIFQLSEHHTRKLEGHELDSR